jgi:hypothetical protein
MFNTSNFYQQNIRKNDLMPQIADQRNGCVEHEVVEEKGTRKESSREGK